MEAGKWTTIAMKLPWSDRSKAVAIQNDKIFVANLFDTNKMGIFHTRNETITLVKKIPGSREKLEHKYIQLLVASVHE